MAYCCIFFKFFFLWGGGGGGQFNWKLVVTSGFDPFCGDNAVIQNRFSKFNF